MKKITLLIAFMLFIITMGYGQTVLINPSGDGGFANGNTFASNGWTVSNSANNPWYVGTVASTGAIAGNAAYVSSTNGTTHVYDVTTPCTNYFYRDVTVPAGQTKIVLSFNWIGQGEGNWDLWQVFTAPTTITPVGVPSHPGSGTAVIPPGVLGSTLVGFGQSQGTVQTATYALAPSLAGTTFRLIFSFKSDTSAGTQPPSAIDNISLTSESGSDFVSVASGNWSSPSTWNLNAVPAFNDISATIAAGHAVTVDTAGQLSPTLTVNGTVNFAAAATTLGVTGNLTVNSGGVVNVLNATTGKAISVFGNIVNNGTIDLSVGTTTAGLLTLNGNTVQTVSGTGTFTNGIIRNLTFANVSTAIPNINWQVNNISVDYNLNISNAKVNLGTNKLTFGTSATSAGNTFSATAGGFMPGGKFARWYTATGTGFTSTGNTFTPTSVAGRYPFYTADGLQRVFLLGRTTPTAGGVYAATYNNVAGSTTGLSILDGTYTITDRVNSNFVVTTEGTTPAEASAWVTIFAQDAYFPANGNSRILKQSSAISGAHSATGGVAGAQRSGVTQADLLSPTGLFIGANTSDVASVVVASGNWNNPAIWNKGVVPPCGDLVVIPNGFTVTVNSVDNLAKGVTIAANASLIISSGDLTIGCTAFNNNFTNNGTFTISGGTLKLNGNMLHNAGSVFNQSGGDIIIDGNDNGLTATSVASGTSIVQLNSHLVNWTGGTLTIVDPHAATFSNTLTYTNSTAHLDITAGHTLRLGDGVSTHQGGTNTYGFRLYTYGGNNRLTFFNVIVDGGAGLNRATTGTTAYGINGNLTITANSQMRDTSGLTLTGNFVNNGSYIETSTLTLGKYLNGTPTAATVAQTISGTGTFANSATPASVTAGLNSFTINNTAGVTLSTPLSVSGTLTLTAGKVTTTGTSVLSLGTATAAGTLSGGGASAYISGPFARTIATGNANTNYIFFPVGKAAYAPVSVAPLTTTVAVMRAEAFDTNTGTFDLSLLDLATNRRWEVPVVSGTVTNLNVRLTDNNLIAANIPVQAPTAAGVYTSTFGSTSVFAAGPPPTVTSNAPLAAASYTGFLSYAKSNLCSGVPAPGNTIASANNICLGNKVTLTVQNVVPGSGVTYQWQSSTDGTTYTDITGATAANYVATPTVAAYYKLKVVCAAGPDTGFSTPVQITFANNVTSPVSAGRCGPGSVVLSATPSTGATINWFANATGGEVLATGSTFTTPTIGATTNFYASSATISPSAIKNVGAGATTSPTYSNPFYSLWSNTHTQHIILAQELLDAGISSGTLTSIALDVTNAGTLPMIDLSIKIGTTTASNMAAFVNNSGFSTVYTSASYLPVTGINTFTFTTPFKWDGTSNIVLEFCHGNGASSATMSRTVKADNTSYISSVKSHISAATNAATICGDTSVGTLGTYSVRPQFIFNNIPICYSPRVAATATINPSPAFTISASSREICEGATSTAVTITTGAADYSTYTWTPATGVTGNAATGWTFNPTVTTTYSLQASNATCNAVPVTVLVTVNPLPSVITLADATYCEGTPSVKLTPFGGTNANIILTENFNAATNGWTKVNNSVGGTVANAAWTLRADSYVYLTETFRSNDNSQFYLSNSGSQGGTLTETILTSPAFSTVSYGSATVSFYQYFKETTNGSSRAAIEFSSNGTDWLESNAFEFTNGAPGAFALATAVVPQTMMNQAAVYVRFKYTGVARQFWALDNVTITGQKSPGYTWTPAAGLYTNAAGTIPYVDGTVLTTVYAKPTATTTYTIKATNLAGCETTVTTTVNIGSTPAPTVPSDTLEICTSGTVANLVATGTAIKWYTAATGGNSLFITTPLTNGTYYATQTVGGCESSARTGVTVTITTIPAPTVPSETQAFCNSGTVADLTVTGNGIKWYTSANGGTALDAATLLEEGVTYYASQSEGTCESVNRASVTVSISVNNAPVIDVPSQTFCNSGFVSDLTVTGTDIKWYTTETGGVALEMTDALSSGTYYASQTIDGCESGARAAKIVVVTLVAAPTGDAEQEFCAASTVAQLTVEGVNIQWYTDAQAGTLVTTDTPIVSGTTYYASQSVDGCEGLTRLAVTAVIYTTVADAPADVTVCNEYILPVLENGAYFTQPNGGGAEVAAGTAVNQTTTFYVYAQQGTDVICSAQNSFIVNVTVVPAPVGDATQTLNGGVEGDVTIEDIQITQIIGGTVVWYPTEEDAVNGTNPIAPGTVLVQGSTYYATQTIGTCTSDTILAVTIDIVLGKDDFDIKAFSYHPNPVTDILNISYSSEITSVTVFNLLGQQIISKQPNATEVKIDMSGLADAAYIVNVTAGNTVKTIKVIKKQ